MLIKNLFLAPDSNGGNTVAFNLPKKESLNNIVNRINSLKERAIGIDTKIEIEEVSSSTTTTLNKLPFTVYDSAVAVWNNEIHIMGSYYNETNHYKFDGSSWTKVSTLPYPFYGGSAVVYNNEIHILGGYDSSTSYTQHYKFDGSSWTSVGVLPYQFSDGLAMIYKGEIHIMGGVDEDGSGTTETNHYKWNGSSWTSVGTLPLAVNHTACAIKDDTTIDLLGGEDNRTSHYRYNGSSWTSISTIPYQFRQGSAVYYDNELHIFGGTLSTTRQNHYKYDGSSWTSVSTVPYAITRSIVINKDSVIHRIGGGNNSTARTKHIVFHPEDSSWSTTLTTNINKLAFSYYLPKGAKIYCDTSIFSPNSSSVSLISITNGYQVNETGNVILDIADNSTEAQKAHSIIID